MKESTTISKLLVKQLYGLTEEIGNVKDPKLKADVVCQLATAAKELELLSKARKKRWEIFIGALMVTFFFGAT